MPSLVGRHGVSLLSVAWTLGSRVFRFSDAALSWEHPNLHIISKICKQGGFNELD